MMRFVNSILGCTALLLLVGCASQPAFKPYQKPIAQLNKDPEQIVCKYEKTAGSIRRVMICDGEPMDNQLVYRIRLIKEDEAK